MSDIGLEGPLSNSEGGTSHFEAGFSVGGIVNWGTSHFEAVFPVVEWRSSSADFASPAPVLVDYNSFVVVGSRCPCDTKEKPESQDR